MAGFIGGSAWNMVKDIAEGFVLLSPTNLKKFEAADFNLLIAEIEKLSREVRGETPAQDDVAEIQKKNRKLQRLDQARLIVQSYRMRVRK